MKKNLVSNVIWAIIVLLVFAGGTLFIYRITSTGGAAPGMGGPQKSSVVVSSPQQRDITEYHEFTGSTEATQEVNIVARVEGYLETINFEDGQYVDKGQLLFEIEPEIYEAQVKQAEAGLKSAKARLKRAETDLERIEKAVKTNAVSKQQLTTAQADVDTAKADVLSYEAALIEARQNLSYTKIYSPIKGRISRNFVDVGNLVGPMNNSLLCTIVNIEPVYIYFNISETLLLSELSKLNGASTEAVKFTFALEGQKDYPNHGTIDYTDNMVDSGTGTITIRGVYPNTDRKILPGMFVRVKLPGRTVKGALLVEEKAIYTDIGGKYLMLVNGENKIEKRYLQLGQLHGEMRLIEQGLEKDMRYVLEGGQFVFPGVEVNPMTQQQMAEMGKQKQNPSGPEMKPSDKQDTAN